MNQVSAEWPPFVGLGKALPPTRVVSAARKIDQRRLDSLPVLRSASAVKAAGLDLANRRCRRPVAFLHGRCDGPVARKTEAVRIAKACREHFDRCSRLHAAHALIAGGKIKSFLGIAFQAGDEAVPARRSDLRIRQAFI